MDTIQTQTPPVSYQPDKKNCPVKHPDTLNFVFGAIPQEKSSLVDLYCKENGLSCHFETVTSPLGYLTFYTENLSPEKKSSLQDFLSSIGASLKSVEQIQKELERIA